MKKIIQILPLVFAFIALSCEKDGLTYAERQLVGTWDYTKVKYTEYWSFNSLDVTQHYDDIQIQFNPDFTAHTYNTFTEASGTGLWELTETYTDDQVVYTIYMSYTDDETGQLSQLVFENASIMSRTIRAYYHDDDGRYRYVLEK